MNHSDMQISPVRLNRAFSLLWFLSRLAAERDRKAHLLRSIHPFTRLHPHRPVWKSWATGNFSLNISTGGRPPFIPFSRLDFALRSDFIRPIIAAAHDIDFIFILYLIQNCGPARFFYDPHGFIAQTICASVFFKFFCIGIHTPDSQFRYHSIQFVSFFKIHNKTSFELFVLLIIIYIPSLGLSRIILKNDYERNQQVMRIGKNKF